MKTEYGEHITRYFMDGLYPEGLPYDLHLYNGQDFSPMSREQFGDSEFTIGNIGTPNRNEAAADAAKNYSALYRDGDPFKLIETRIKGGPFASQQSVVFPWNQARHTHRPR